MDSQWRPAIGGMLARRVTQVAVETAKRCLSQEGIRQAFSGNTPHHHYWSAGTVAGGDAGLALLYAYMHACFPGGGWDAAVYDHLERAVSAYNWGRLNVSLFTGMSGLGFVVEEAAGHGAQYLALRQGINAYLSVCAPAFVARARARGLYAHSFDLIKGTVGVAAYLLSLPVDRLAFYGLSGALDSTLRYLVSLTEPDPTTGMCCFVSSREIRIEQRRQRFPWGYTDTGMAHGVSGVVGALALAQRAGHRTPGLREGLAALAYWLNGHRIEDAYGINWPSFLAPPMDTGRVNKQSRAAWCYGVPGTARALFLAAEALDDPSLRETALEAFRCVMVRPEKFWRVFAPNFCHGFSGMLHTYLRMYQDTSLPEFLPFIERLARRLLSFYDTQALFGFKDSSSGSDWYDNPRLLDGAAGVALTLLAASQPVNPSWDRLFLLS